MPVIVLLIVAIVLFAALLLVADRTVKAIRRGRRLREADRRLAAVTAAAAAAAQAKERQRTATAEASTALTALMPTIHEHETRHVD